MRRPTQRCESWLVARRSYVECRTGFSAARLSLRCRASGGSGLNSTPRIRKEIQVRPSRSRHLSRTKPCLDGHDTVSPVQAIIPENCPGHWHDRKPMMTWHILAGYGSVQTQTACPRQLPQTWRSPPPFPLPPPARHLAELASPALPRSDRPSTAETPRPCRDC